MISLVIPTYNHKRALAKCLQAVLAQNYTDWEVIIVDDGSIDGTGQWLRSYLAEHRLHDKIHYAYQENKGAPAARNKGASMAIGEEIMFLDADVILVRSALERLHGELKANPDASFAYSDFRFGWKSFRASKFEVEKLQSDNFIHTTALLRKVAFPGFDESLKRFQDWDLWLTMAGLQHFGVYVPEELFSVLVTRKGMSSWKPRLWYRLCQQFPSLAPESYWRYEEARRVVVEKHSTGLERMATPQISVVMVTWNNAEEIEDTLRRLEELPEREQMEVIVVDNASTDGTPDIIQTAFPSVRLIRSRANAGFGRACNQGAKEARGKTLVFLNPDARPTNSALQSMSDFLEEQPNIGIVGPQLRYSDNSIQPSCRRFPDLVSTVLIFLKVHLFFPSLAPFRRHFMQAFQHDTMRMVDQVMGACLVIRAEHFRRINGFDERYYLWYDDVDLCKRSRDEGYLTMFYPGAQVIHGLSTSFTKRRLLWKQWHLTKSARTYFLRHQGLVSWLALFAVSVLSFVPVVLLSPFQKFSNAPRVPASGESKETMTFPFFPWVATLIAIEFLSFLSHYYSVVGTATFALVGILYFVLALRRYSWAVLALLLEIFVGSHGYIISTVILGERISLRLLLFVIIMIVSLVQILRGEARKFVSSAWPILLLLAISLLAFIHGLTGEAPVAIVFLDGNAYLFLALVLPLFLAAKSDEQFIFRAFQLLVGAAVYLALKTLLLLYFFTHHFDGFLIDLYQWLRDARLAELTPTKTGAYRIFVPSQLYIIIAWFLLLVPAPLKRFNWRRALVLGLLAAALLVSFSRSYWLGWIGATGLYGLWLLIFQRKYFWSVFLASASGICVGIVMVLLVLNIPFPSASSSGSFELQERFEFYQEEAASSRWNLLQPLVTATQEHILFGSGFGSTVTYISNDPRVRAVHPDGQYTTTAFEWGYLDIVLKIGLVGLMVYLWIIGRDAWALWHSRKQADGAWYVGLLFALLAVLLVHVGSPYLNHPLGFTFILLVWVVAERERGRA